MNRTWERRDVTITHGEHEVKGVLRSISKRRKRENCGWSWNPELKRRDAGVMEWFEIDLEVHVDSPLVVNVMLGEVTVTPDPDEHVENWHLGYISINHLNEAVFSISGKTPIEYIDVGERVPFSDPYATGTIPPEEPQGEAS